MFNPNHRMSIDEALSHPYLHLFRDKGSEIEMSEPMVLYDTSKESVDTIEERIYDLVDNQFGQGGNKNENLSQGIRNLVENKVIQDPYQFRKKNAPVNNFFKNTN